MKIEFLNEVPCEAKRRYMKWGKILGEFFKSDKSVMKLTVNPIEDGDPFNKVESIRNAIKRYGYRMTVYARNNFVIVEKMKVDEK